MRNYCFIIGLKQKIGLMTVNYYIILKTRILEKNSVLTNKFTLECITNKQIV